MNHICDNLRTALSKYAPTSLRKAMNYNSSPLFESIKDELCKAKRERPEAERKWRSTKLNILGDLYRQAKHKVSKHLLTANCKPCT